MTSKTTTNKSAPRKGNVLIEENLTEKQKLMIHLVLVGVLFLRSLIFYYQEGVYADPDHPEHKHYNDAKTKKQVNFAAAILVFLWYLYSTYFVEPFYHKYVTRASELGTAANTNSQEEDPSDEKSPEMFDEASSNTRASLLLDTINPNFPVKVKKNQNKTKVVQRQKILRDPLCKTLVPQLPKKMKLRDFEQWRLNENVYMDYNFLNHILNF